MRLFPYKRAINKPDIAAHNPKQSTIHHQLFKSLAIGLYNISASLHEKLIRPRVVGMNATGWKRRITRWSASINVSQKITVVNWKARTTIILVIQF